VVQEPDDRDLVTDLRSRLGGDLDELFAAAQSAHRAETRELLVDLAEGDPDEIRFGYPVGANRDVGQSLHRIFDTTGPLTLELLRFGLEVDSHDGRQEANDQDQADQAEDVGDGVGRRYVRHHLIRGRPAGHRNLTRAQGFLRGGQGGRARHAAREQARSRSELEVQ
jgi:hypothetical protein